MNGRRKFLGQAALSAKRLRKPRLQRLPHHILGDITQPALRGAGAGWWF